MALVFKVVKIKSNPLNVDSPLKFYPKAVNVGKKASFKQIIDLIYANSSLSRGDVLNVVQNFVEKLREQLLEGKTVFVDGLGSFSLSIRSKGEETEKEVTVRSIRTIHITFRAHKELRINSKTTRIEDFLSFIRLEDYLKTLKLDLDLINRNPSGNIDPPIEM